MDGLVEGNVVVVDTIEDGPVVVSWTGGGNQQEETPPVERKKHQILSTVGSSTTKRVVSLGGEKNLPVVRITIDRLATTTTLLSSS